MPANERRLMPRKPLSVPVRYRVLTNNPNQMLRGESLDWSDGGIFFVTPDQLQVGSRLQIFLKLPYQPGGPPVMEVQCTARVVRIKPNARPGAQHGVAAFIELFERAPELPAA